MSAAMWQPPQTCFEIKPIEQWGSTIAAPNNSPNTDPEKKRLFALELAKGLKPFDAALNIYPDNTGLALWVSQNWLNDPEVIQTKEQSNQTEIKLLDKEQLAAKVLKFSEEKDPSNKFYLAEDKVRLAALKLYAEICGYVGKVDIDLSTKNFTNNEMKIVLVSPEKEEKAVVIDNELEIVDNVLPLPIKLVG